MAGVIVYYFTMAIQFEKVNISYLFTGKNAHNSREGAVCNRFSVQIT